MRQDFASIHEYKFGVMLIEITSAPGLGFSLPSALLEVFARNDHDLQERFCFSRQIHYGGSGLLPITQKMRELFDADGVPSIIAFTVYFWNRQLTGEIIAWIKKNWPDIVIVVGGNDIKNDPSESFAANPLVDFICRGEGELAFAGLLHDLASGISRSRLPRVRSISERIDPLDSIPSPFSLDVITPEEIRASSMIIYESNRGCPFKCAFCYWGGATGEKVRRYSRERVRSDIGYITQHASNGATIFLADANFGMHRDDLVFARLLADAVQKSGKRILIFVNWAKNTNERVIEAAEILFSGGLVGAVTLSAQTLTESALNASGRSNIPYRHYAEIQARLKQKGIPTYTELLLGLPAETFDQFLAGIDRVLSVGGHPVVYPLLLLNNTEFARPETIEKWRMEVKRVPYQLWGSEGSEVDMVVGNSCLSHAAWIDAMRIVFTMAITYHLVGRSTIDHLCSTTGLACSAIFTKLRTALDERRLPLSEDAYLILDNHSSTLLDHRNFDWDLVSARTGENPIPDNLHFQALAIEILRDVSGDGQRASRLVRSLISCVTPEGSNHEFETPIADDTEWLLWLCAILGVNRPQEPTWADVSQGSVLLGIYHGAIGRWHLEREGQAA